MAAPVIPLARLSLVYRSSAERIQPSLHGRLVLWAGGAALALVLYFGINAFWNWKHTISTSGGRYFVHRIEIPVPAFSQDDPRWSLQLLGPTIDTVGQQGCALTSAAMVMSYYGIDTDPQRLNQFLNLNGGYTPNGWIYWEKAADLAPARVQKAYEDLPSYALIDQNLLAGNPVIVRLTLRNGTTHFVVLVGKQGWDYLTRDPARDASWGIYPLKDLTPHIEALRFYRTLGPEMTSHLASQPSTSVVLTASTPH